MEVWLRVQVALATVPGIDGLPSMVATQNNNTSPLQRVRDLCTRQQR
eukprot:CAMPEP_0175174520 /NCGR_PEP_ID=MMETSP0087-20121206/32682_1 /TAXON_ID=136419 /ORGANISM="Unknown Unknown, Strain D1" /LENGTH=46 /DNA_ID= /DNA_START= /DNA_END= /DNA_ORIENTATION=